MNPARIANLLEELADAFRDEAAPTDEPCEEPRSASSPDATQPTRLRIPMRPAGESDELARAAARRALRENGFLEVKR